VLSVNVALGLGPGTYSGNINIASSGVSNSPRTVPVTVTVTPGVSSFHLTNFPLPGFGPDTADIISIFDHSMFLTLDGTKPFGSTTECYDGKIWSYRAGSTRKTQ